LRSFWIVCGSLLLLGACTTTSEVGDGDSATTTGPGSQGGDGTTTTTADPAAFCEQLEPLRDIEVGEQSDENIDQIEELIDDAPEDLQNGLTEFVAFARDVQGRDVSDPAVLEEISQMVTPELVEFAGDITRFTQNECLFGVPIFAAVGGAGSNPSPEVVSEAIAQNQPDLGDRVVGVTVDPVYVVQIDGLTDPGEAVELCQALVAELGALGTSPTARVKVTGDEAQPLATSNEIGACVPAA
jgi:hypothetical protein